jgi:hypothetical protein
LLLVAIQVVTALAGCGGSANGQPDVQHVACALDHPGLPVAKSSSEVVGTVMELD